MLGRKLNLVGLTRGDADAVGHCFNSTKSPTRAAVRLITDRGNRRALGPSSARVEGVGDVVGLGGSDDLGQLGVRKHTQPAANSRHLDSKEATVKARSPGSIGGVHLIDDSLIVSRSIVQQGGSQSNGSKGSDQK